MVKMKINFHVRIIDVIWKILIYTTYWDNRLFSIFINETYANACDVNAGISTLHL